MLPALYLPTTGIEDALSNNGLGFIKDCVSCYVSEELNGIYELTAEVLYSDRLAKYINEQSLIRATPNAVDQQQIFVISNVRAEENRLKITANHIHYRLFDNVFDESYLATDMTPLEVWEDIQMWLVYNNPFEFTSSISTKSSVTAAEQSPIRLGEFIVGHEGSMIDVYGGELRYDNLAVSLERSRGDNTGIGLRCGGGINDIEYEVSSDAMYTDIAPYALIPTKQIDNGTNMITGQLYVYIPLVSTGNISLRTPRALSYDFSDTFQREYPNFAIAYHGSVPDAASYQEARGKLLTLANRYISQNADRLRKPSINVKIDIDASDNRFDNCKLGDVVDVYYTPLQMHLTAKIIRLQYDVLLGRYTRVELGEPLRNIARFFPNKNIGGV